MHRHHLAFRIAGEFRIAMRVEVGSTGIEAVRWSIDYPALETTFFNSYRRFLSLG